VRENELLAYLDIAFAKDRLEPNTEYVERLF
jgi:hypothetical protein